MVVDIELKKKSIDQVLDGPRPAEYRVLGKPFLRILVRKHKVSLAVRLNRRGLRKCEVLGEYPYLSLKDFERLGTERYTQCTQSAYPHLAEVTFGQVFEELFVTLKQRERLRTLPKYQQLYRDFLADTLGPRRLSAITSLDVVNALKEVSETRSDASYNHVRVLVVGVFKVAIAYNLTSFDPTRAVPPRKLDNIVKRYLTEPEVEAFVAACRTYRDSLPHQALLLALLTGARIGNIITLHKADTAPDRSQLTFRKTKSGRAQTLPVDPAVVSVLKHIQSLSDPASEFLFSSDKSRTGHITHPRQAFIDLCREAGIATRGSVYPLRPGFPTEPVNIHSLRKTYATAALEATGNLYSSSQLLGHSSLEVTKRYAFVTQQSLENAVNATTARLLGQSEFQVQEPSFTSTR